MASCGAIATLAPRPSDRAIAPLAEVTAKLAVRRFEGKPPLATVVREGDPAATFAAVILIDDAGAGAAPALAAILEDRLRDRGARAQVARGAIVVTWETGGPPGALRSFFAAFGASITATSGLGRRTAELSGPVVPPGLEAAARCSGAPLAGDVAATSNVATATGAAGVESLRKRVATSEHVSLAIVGAQTAVDAASRELQAAPSWAAGKVSRSAMSADAGVALIPAEGPLAGRDPGADLVISIDLPSAARGPAMARTLGDGSDPLATQLALLGPRFTIAEASGVARAGGTGSCLRLDLRARRPEAIDADAVGYAVRIVRSASTRAVKDEAAAAARAIVTAGDPREAAARAAWWTTTSDGVGTSNAPLFVAVAERAAPAAHVTRLTAGDTTRAIERVSRAQPRAAIERRVRHEPGQGAFVMAAGSPCPSSIDTRTQVDSAALALGLVAAARQSVDFEVELTPFIGADGAGLVARGEPRPGESGVALATRVALALGAALGGRPPPTFEIERARSRLVEGAAREWGHPETSEALLRAMEPERPLALAPLGLEPALVRADAVAAAAAPADVLAGPVRAAVLSNVDGAQSDRAIATLETLLPPGPIAPCPGSHPQPAGARGRVDVRVAGDERFAQLSWATGPLGSEAAEVAVAILQLTDGELARAAASVGASVRVRRVGTAVMIDTRVAPERTDEAFVAMSAALDRISRSELDEPTARRVRGSAHARLRDRTADPVSRAVELWIHGAVTLIDPVDPRSISPRLEAASWLVVVARPS